MKMNLKLIHWTFDTTLIFKKIFIQSYNNHNRVAGLNIYSYFEDLNLKLAEEQTIKIQYNTELKSY